MPNKHKEKKFYTEKDYKSKLLQLERRLIKKAMIKCNGRAIDAHILLCPKGYPYSYSALLKVIKRHQI